MRLEHTGRRGRLIERHALAAVDARATVWIPARDQHPVLRDRRAIEPEECRSLHIVQSESATDLLSGHAVEDLETLFELGARELFRHALHVHGLRAADRDRRVEDR